MTWVAFFRTNYDLTTTILSNQVMKPMVEYAGDRLLSVVDFEGDNATRSNFYDAVFKYNPEFVFIGSHGESDRIASQEAGFDILSLTNAQLMNNRIGYFVACKSGQELAPACVDNGAKCVFAFDDDLTLMAYSEEQGYKLCEGFVECLTKPMLLFDGFKAQDVYNLTKEEYERWISFWDEREPFIADVLRHDRDAFKLYGSGGSRLTFSWWLIVGLTDYLGLTFMILAVLWHTFACMKVMYYGRRP